MFQYCLLKGSGDRLRPHCSAHCPREDAAAQAPAGRRGAQTRKPAPTFRSGDPAARPGLSTACVCFLRLLHQTLVA